MRRFSATAAEFHEACLARRRQLPDAMLATATHDHKRGEDVRARLAVLSEIPDEWERVVRRWLELNAGIGGMAMVRCRRRATRRCCTR